MRTTLLLLALTLPATALEPKDLVLLVNTRLPASRHLAEHYCQARGVPRENIIEFALTTEDEITREDYDAKLATPLREALKPRKNAVKCIVCMYGMPLRVGPKTPTAGEKAEAERLKKGLEAAKAKAADPATQARGQIELATLQSDIMKLEQRESQAAVDSELMLLWWPDYPLTRWVMNPLHWQMPTAKRRLLTPAVMTARLDGPTPEVVKRMIDDAVAVEAVGLAGGMAIDARGIPFDSKKPDENGGYGYGGYDESFRETATLFKDKLTVTLDDKPECFAVGAVKDVALYAGWYSHGKFIDCCTYTRGAVAWHLASSEAVTLHREANPLWCRNILKAGACVTLGPVAEPYTVGFPKPAEFFGFLATGEYTLAEVHAMTTHFASWHMTLLGDPLYTPFKKKPLLKRDDVFASPKAGRSLFR